MEGLQVAPTAPCAMEYVSSSTEAESFQRQVGVVCVILWSGLLYWSVEATGAMNPPASANVCKGKRSTGERRRSRWTLAVCDPGIESFEIFGVQWRNGVKSFAVPPFRKIRERMGHGTIVLGWIGSAKPCVA